MKSVFRAFIAIELSPDVVRKVDEVSSSLRERMGELPIRWTPAENVHLTLKFLGDVSTTSVDNLAEIIQRVARSHACFEMSIGGLGIYPDARRPRVIWLGVEAPQKLNAIQRSIEHEINRLGYEKSDREFSPHLTIGRVSRSADFQELKEIGSSLQNENVGFLGATRVDHINLFRSDLKPSGAEYSRVFSAPLQEIHQNEKR